MKIGPGGSAPFRSMGIPEPMREAIEKQQAEKQKPAEEPKPEPVQEEAVAEEKKDDSLNPMKMLEAVGVTVSEDDLHALLFKGYYEVSDLVVVKAPKQNFTASLKTLTGHEFDEVDELLAQETKDIPMTNQGFESRRSMWILAYGVTHLMGKPVVKPVMDPATKSVDLMETAKKRREVIGNLSPSVLTKLIQVHSAIQVALNLIVQDPERTFIKKS